MHDIITFHGEYYKSNLLMIQEYLMILPELVKFIKSRTIHLNKLLNYMENIQQWSKVESLLFELLKKMILFK